MQDIGFDHINPSIFIGEIFLDDTGKFTVCNGCGVLPVMTGQHFILKAIFIPFDLADDGGIQDPMFRNAFYQIIEPVALIQPERMASESTNGLRGRVMMVFLVGKDTEGVGSIGLSSAASKPRRSSMDLMRGLI